VKIWLALLVCFSTIDPISPARAGAATEIPVGPGESIQAAIDAARDGDVVRVAAGTYVEDIDFRGKAIAVVGSGPSSVLHGTGGGPVVTFASGESPASVLDSLTITGGLAVRGGGIYVSGASPTIVRNRILRNRAHGQGSGIYLASSAAAVFNNLIARNTTFSLASGDAHGVDVQGGAPALVNNTIADGDSNGIILRASPGALVRNNVIAFNGSRRLDNRGRGICDFSGGATIQHNLFYANQRAAILSSTFVDYERIQNAERRLAVPEIAGNRDGTPRFRDRRRDDYRLGKRSRALDLGDPDPAFADRDGSRNDAGYTGGPLAPDW
jgi:nitrous oxidase accessory protein NosD